MRGGDVINPTSIAPIPSGVSSTVIIFKTSSVMAWHEMCDLIRVAVFSSAFKKASIYWCQGGHLVWNNRTKSGRFVSKTILILAK